MTNAKPKSTRRPDQKSLSLGDVLPEAEALVRAGKERSLSALVRRAIRLYLNPEQQANDPRPMTFALGQLRLELSRIGSNLNQLAHGFNMRGPVAFKRDELAESHEALQSEFRVVMTKLDEIERVFLRGNNQARGNLHATRKPEHESQQKGK